MREEILKIIDKTANDIYQEMGKELEYTEKTRTRALIVASLDLIYNYRIELQKRLEEVLPPLQGDTK